MQQIKLERPSMVSSIKPYFIILRPTNVVITFFSVLLILWISDSAHDPQSVRAAIYAAISAAVICGGANILNDYFDIDIDRINKPERVLVQGLLSKSQALGLWFLTSTAGLYVSYQISSACFLIAFLAVGMLAVYSWHLKRTALWGNATVSLFAALAFIYGGVAIHKPEQAVVPAAFAFLLHFGREILKDIEDVEGDQKLSARTFPVVYGSRSALLLATFAFMILIVMTVKVYLLGYYHERYLWIVLFGVHPVLAFTIYSMWKDASPGNLHLLNNLLKFAMGIGLAAIYFG